MPFRGPVRLNASLSALAVHAVQSTGEVGQGLACGGL
jgi:hypothetical protein